VVCHCRARGPVPGQPRGRPKKLTAWVRWHAGAGPGLSDGTRLWDFEDRYGDSFTAEACSQCKTICADCPQPRLLPDAQPGALAYLTCATQFQYAPSGVPTGLRYADCLAMLTARAEALGITDIPQALADLQHAERARIGAAVEHMRQERRDG
jgi:hypothetical protein